MRNNLQIVAPDQVRQAAEETANPIAIVEAAIAKLTEDPAAIYSDEVIAALRTIREKDELAYTRLVMKADGHKTRLDKLTTPVREESDGASPDRIIKIAQEHCQLRHDADGRAVAIIDDGCVRHRRRKMHPFWFASYAYPQTNSAMSTPSR